MELNNLFIGLNKIKQKLNVSGKFKKYVSVDLSPKVPDCHYEERKTLQEIEARPYGDCGNNIIHSDPRLKTNIKQIDDYDALSKLKDIKFFSYDYRDTSSLPPHLRGSHVDIGTLTIFLPKELVHSNFNSLGEFSEYDSIDINSYLNLIARAVQQLNKEVESIKMQNQLKVIVEKEKEWKRLMEDKSGTRWSR